MTCLICVMYVAPRGPSDVGALECMARLTPHKRTGLAACRSRYAHSMRHFSRTASIRRFAMPTYEYRCEMCGEKFEHAEHISEHATTHPVCPKCGSEKVQHLPTQFVAKTSRKS
ncbi:FmdB family zinc ribbon protein [Paraburkholderia humisilvae]